MSGERTIVQQVALAVIPKFPAALSLFGSLWISMQVLSSPNKRRSVYNRLLLGMSSYDVMNSSWMFASTWPMPVGTGGVFGAMGTRPTCSVQGFFLQMGLAVPIYNASLSFYYLLVINYNVSERKLKRWIEPAMHFVAFGFPFGTSLFSALTGLFNASDLWCWIAHYPLNCLNSHWHGGEGNCQRGDNAFLYRWAFYFGPLWSCISLAIVFMVLIYRKVRKQDVKSLRYRRPENKFGTSKEKPGNFVRGQRPSLVTNPAPTEGRSNGMSSSKKATGATLQDPYPVLGSQKPAQASTAQQSQQRSSTDCRQTTATPSLGSLIAKWKSSHEEFAKNNPNSYQFYQQAKWYLGAFLVTFFWTTVNRMVQQATGQSYLPLIILQALFEPLQGFLNLLVFLRPRYLRLQKQSPELSAWELMQRALRWWHVEDTMVGASAVTTTNSRDRPPVLPTTTTSGKRTSASSLSNMPSAPTRESGRLKPKRIVTDSERNQDGTIAESSNDSLHEEKEITGLED